MPQSVRAVMKVAPGESGVELRTTEIPDPEPGFVRLRVEATGVCGTDIHIARDEYGCEMPVVMGHEILGVVDAVGDSADELWISRRVATETYYSTCGSCATCRDGRVNLCRDRRSIGSFENGGFAPFVIVPTGNLHAVPAGIGAGAVLAEPLACVAQCLCDPSVVEAHCDERLRVDSGLLATSHGASGVRLRRSRHASDRARSPGRVRACI